MSFIWETHTESGTIDGNATGITLENYYLYTRDIQLSRGGTAGIAAAPLVVDNLIHPDYYRCGRDEFDDWTQVAVFSKPGETNVLIQIWVQDYVGLDDELGVLRFQGKQMAIPLNSGPGYLATRPDDEYILSTPQNSIFFGINWGYCRSDMHNLHTYITNDLVQPANGAKKPYDDGVPRSYTGSVFTESERHIPTSIRVQNTTAQDTQHMVDFPQTKGHLQSGLPDGSAYATQFRANFSPVYTGGTVVVHGRTEQPSGDPLPVVAQLGANFQTNNIMALSDATLIDTVDDGTTVYRFWRLEKVLDVAVDFNFTDAFAGGNIFPKKDFQVSDPFGIITSQAYGVYFDPWKSLAMPPAYTITSNDGDAVKGGYIP